MNHDLSAVVQRITQSPMRDRMKIPKDLGEVMVIAHAVVAAEAGQDVVILIDDGQGARMATLEIARLERIRSQGRAVGLIRLVNTLAVLERAAGTQHIPDRSAMRDIYERMYRIDDGLPPLQRTDLLSARLWT